MMKGTPSIVPAWARLTLQMATIAMPATAMRPIFIATRLRGAVSRPRRRLRASCSQSPPPAAPTRTTSKIQLTTGLNVPQKML